MSSLTSTNSNIEGFVCEGPLVGKLGLSPEEVKENISWWKTLGDELCRHLTLDKDNLSDAESKRLFHYYLPVYHWFERTLMTHQQSSEKPLVVGISAPQGCGKTTLVSALEGLFKFRGHTAATVSIDDFYLTFENQQVLAASNPDNELLQYRGNAGSHDLALGTTTLQKLIQARSEGTSAATPRYDKSAHAGRGDRAAEEKWPVLEGPLSVVLFEGWMSGFSPLLTEEVAAVDPQLVPVNEALRSYKTAWDKYCDAWFVVKVEDFNWVQKWRLQAEVAMRSEGKAALSDEQVQDFVNRFLPAYKAYLPGLYANGPCGSTKDTPVLMLEVDQSRNVQG
eukprot:CAMPEP_0196592082 /NCGR_PEP_ID=MMETSP1081-20130531/71727_1 /TAXON_ID=36882 /ORGANISM="Pyramimonas amylifera, Strain CCMP720" /LENGTH=336 /DNA_ID=CAMNT_0041915659 /DNA_START=52 /DNA_END=1062 /DNA_ORIENTATION=-